MKENPLETIYKVNCKSSYNLKKTIWSSVWSKYVWFSELFTGKAMGYSVSKGPLDMCESGFNILFVSINLNFKQLNKPFNDLSITGWQK